MKNALIGFSGFVGGTLMKQASFQALFRSTNIHEIEGNSYDIIVCAGAPAQKWIANSEPDQDRRKIEVLINHLKKVRCKTFILISTVDVFRLPIGVDEDTVVDEIDLHAYGLHRRELEKFVQAHFDNVLVVRLPGLVGPGLRKNLIYDFLNENNLNAIESRGVFQFYPMVNLWFDIQLALNSGLKLVHLTSEPISVADVAELGFGRHFEQHFEAGVIGKYDMRTKYDRLFGSNDGYQYSQREAIQAIRAYAQSEPKNQKMYSGKV